jgi:hypothetical protein
MMSDRGSSTWKTVCFAGKSSVKKIFSRTLRLPKNLWAWMERARMVGHAAAIDADAQYSLFDDDDGVARLAVGAQQHARK